MDKRQIRTNKYLKKGLTQLMNEESYSKLRFSNLRMQQISTEVLFIYIIKVKMTSLIQLLKKPSMK